MTLAMASDRAERRLSDFQKQCGEYGETALHLAYHAALPVALNAELLHLLRINFFLDPPEVLPYTAEFEFLLSPLCREIDEGLYEIEPEIRDALLAGLTQTYDAQRIRDIATLLWQYIDCYSPWADRLELERAQQLTTLNFLNPEKAQQWLAMVATEVSRGHAATREWFVAIRQEIENQTQLLQHTTSDHLQELNELPTKDFFISYAIEDEKWAEWIAWALESTGHSVVIQTWDFNPGGNFALDMQRVATGTKQTIVVLSENYLKTVYAQPELINVFIPDSQGLIKKLFPIRVGECEPVGILKSIAYVDLVGLSEIDSQQRLLSALKVKSPKNTLIGQVPYPGLDESRATEESEQPFDNLEQLERQRPTVLLRSLSTSKEWTMQGEVMRIGASLDNDLALSGEPGISRQHAEIFYRYLAEGNNQPTYFLRDFSRYGTWILLPENEEWQKFHQQEVILPSGTQLRFGSSKNSILEFSITDSEDAQLEILKKFQKSLEDGREAAAWLDEHLTQLAQLGGRLALEQFPDVKKLASPNQIDDFYFSVKQFLEQISFCLRWGSYDILDEPGIPIIFDNKIYEATFRIVQNRLSTQLSDEPKEEFIHCIDYLIEALERVEEKTEGEDQNEASSSDAAVLIDSRGTVRSNSQAVQVFISYDRKDQALYDQLVRHLNVLQQQKVIAAWHDRCTSHKQELDYQIDSFLNSADIILFLISADFFASCHWEAEVTRALERHNAGETRVIPVILRPVDWENTPLSKLQALPKNAKPITTWGNRDEAFLNVIQEIREVAAQMTERRNT